MAAFAIRSTLKAVQNYLAASGWVRTAQVGEPKSPPGEGVTAAVFMSNWSVAQLTLSTTIEVHTVTLRFYRNMLQTPTEDIEFELARILSEVTSDLLGEFDLGATIRNVDAGGQYGQGLSARWGYVDVGGTLYRLVDLTLPLIVDDSATLVQ